MMDVSRFSRAAFDALGNDAEAIRRLADELQDAVLEEVGAAASEQLNMIAAALNEVGHNLSPIAPQSIGRLYLRDDSNPDECALRLATDVIVSAGYKDEVILD